MVDGSSFARAQAVSRDEREAAEGRVNPGAPSAAPPGRDLGNSALRGISARLARAFLPSCAKFPRSSAGLRKWPTGAVTCDGFDCALAERDRRTAATEALVSTILAEALNNPYWLEQLPPIAAQCIYQTFCAKNKVQ
jgi:hypothetical protein